jgi:D-serine deaminase-like pyridoxal phosphate-dependent protein
MSLTLGANSLIVQDWRSPPAAPGMALEEVDTPALLLDADAMDHNIALMQEHMSRFGVALRPHGKAHKSPDIAHRQIQAGAIGICCQKASEAEEFADAGIENILISNEVVGAIKTARVARLAQRAHIGLCVDNAVQIHQIGAAARSHGVTIDILVELDIGHGRCGVGSPDEALALARLVAHYAPNLHFSGLQAYNVAAQHIGDPVARSRTVAASMERLRDVIAALAEAGFECRTVTGGGTGTCFLDAASGIYTEVQPGSYALMDIDYAAVAPTSDAPSWRHALFGYCTVSSLHNTHAVLDGGLKAFAVDSGPPRVQHPGWNVKTLSDEHTVIVPQADAAALSVGDKVRLIPGHCDPTVNLHDWLIVMRGNVVEDVWPVAARGALF